MQSTKILIPQIDVTFSCPLSLSAITAHQKLACEMLIYQALLNAALNVTSKLQNLLAH